MVSCRAENSRYKPQSLHYVIQFHCKSEGDNDVPHRGRLSEAMA